MRYIILLLGFFLGCKNLCACDFHNTPEELPSYQQMQLVITQELLTALKNGDTARVQALLRPIPHGSNIIGLRHLKQVAQEHNRLCALKLLSFYTESV